MRSKHNYFVFGILLVVILGVILISGCVQSPETKQFAKNLPQINENLKISLKNIHTDFYNYDLDYGVNRLMNMLTITDSMIIGMEKEENGIREDISNAEETISNFQTVKQSVNTNQLSDDEKNIISQIDAKVNEYVTNKEKLNSCLSKMKIYKDWIVLVKDNAKLVEEFGTK